MKDQRAIIQKDDICSMSESIPDGTLSKGSVIVYVWRQRDAEVIAEQLIADGISGGVVIYHGGMNADARARAQSKVRITLNNKFILFQF